MSTTLMTTPAKNVATAASSKSQPVTPNSTSYQPSPGRFRHPRLTEIIERRSKVSLTSRDVQNAGVNAGVLMLTFVLGDFLYTISETIASALSLPTDLLDPGFLIVLVRILLLVNIIYCLRPVIPYMAKSDNISDIPLTPTQRALLGLPPSTSASAQGDASALFVTPPRYRRNSATSTGSNSSSQASTTDRRSISANYSSSPLSASRYSMGFSSPASSRTYRRASGSPFAYSPGGSPLLYKAVANNNSSNNVLDFDNSRSSFGTSTGSGFGLSRSQSMRDRRAGDLDTSIGPGTPSPTARKAAGGGINYKWLYDKGGKLPKRDNAAF